MSCKTNTIRFVVSSYSKPDTADVRLFEINNKGIVNLFSEKALANNPSFFGQGINGLLYFADEVSSFNGNEGGGITTLRVNETGLETIEAGSINQGGGGPCFITMSQDKGYLITANYGSGSVSVVKTDDNGMPVNITDTVFFSHPDSLVSHPHMVLYNPVKEVYYVTDLGLDRVYIFTFNITTGKLIPAEIPFFDVEKGSGPRHMVMDDKYVNLYIANELNSTVSVYNMSGNRAVLEQSISALPDDFKGISYCGDICLSPSGNYLYVTNRGSNTIGVFKVEDGGTLSLAGHVSCGGNWPRNMALDIEGKNMIVCNQRSGEISFFRINEKTGLPEKTSYSYKLNAPSCVKFIE